MLPQKTLTFTFDETGELQYVDYQSHDEAVRDAVCHVLPNVTVVTVPRASGLRWLSQYKPDCVLPLIQGSLERWAGLYGPTQGKLILLDDGFPDYTGPGPVEDTYYLDDEGEEWKR